MGDFAFGEFGGGFLFRFEFAVGLVLFSARDCKVRKGGGGCERSERGVRTDVRLFGLERESC